jgi:hypothetical protein
MPRILSLNAPIGGKPKPYGSRSSRSFGGSCSTLHSGGASISACSTSVGSRSNSPTLSLTASPTAVTSRYHARLLDLNLDNKQLDLDAYSLSASVTCDDRLRPSLEVRRSTKNEQYLTRSSRLRTGMAVALADLPSYENQGYDAPSTQATVKQQPFSSHPHTLDAPWQRDDVEDTWGYFVDFYEPELDFQPMVDHTMLQKICERD